jgi:hypothetical protein
MEGILMDNFITLNYLGSFVGMVAVVVLLTQFTKDLVDKVAKWLPTKYVVFIYALIVIFGYQLMSNTFDNTKLLLTILNAVLLTMTAQGGYEWLYKPIEQKAAANAITKIVTPTETIYPNQNYSNPTPEKPAKNNVNSSVTDPAQEAVNAEAPSAEQNTLGAQ